MRDAIVLFSFLGACGGSPGTIVDAGADVSFVSERGAAVVDSEAGIVAIALDGSQRRTLFAEKKTIDDVSADYRTWVGHDADTNLFVGDLASGSWQRVPELDGIASAAAISPDGKRVIVSRHRDFDRPGNEDDDTLYLVDVESLTVDVLPQSSGAHPTGLSWTTDGASVIARMAFDNPPQQIDIATKTRSAVKDEAFTLFLSPPRTHAKCEAEIVFDKFDTEVKVRQTSGTIVTVVREEGRERGWHDYGSDFGDPKFTPQCGYVLFSFAGKTWLADAAGSGKTGPLVDGWLLFFADASLVD